MNRYLFLTMLLLLPNLLLSRSDALIVGVGQYKNNIPSLWGVEKDVKNIKKLFQHLGIHNITTLQNQNATLHGIREAFQNYINSPKNHPNNNFIFYYSGHGVQVHDTLKPKSNIIINGLLLDDEMYTILGKIKSKKILIFDKCHSDSSHRGSFIRALPQVYKLSEKFSKEIGEQNNTQNALTNFALFSATKDKEEAEDSPFGGLFTNSIIDGILYKKADLNHNGMITVHELEQFCNNNISQLATNINKGSGGGLKGDFTPKFSPTEILNHTIDSIFKTKIQKSKNKPIVIAQTEYTPIIPYPQEEPLDNLIPNIITKPEYIPTTTYTIEETYDSLIPNNITKIEYIPTITYLLEDTLDSFVSNETLQLELINNKIDYREHERVRFELKSSMSGYLNIFIAYQDNYKLFMKNRKIHASKLYSFPNDFFKRKHLIAKKPYGMTKIYAILSRTPLDIEKYLSNSSLDKDEEDLSLTNHLRRGVMIEYDDRGEVVEEAEILGIGRVWFEVFWK